MKREESSAGINNKSRRIGDTAILVLFDIRPWDSSMKVSITHDDDDGDEDGNDDDDDGDAFCGNAWRQRGRLGGGEQQQQQNDDGDNAKVSNFLGREQF